MKYIKKYEEISPYPEVGDYVIVNSDRDTLEDRINEIAKIIRINNNRILSYRYEVKFDDGEELYISGNEFDFCSENRTELEAILQSNKYNL